MQSRAKNGSSKLTKTERTVCGLLLEGLTEPEIARRMKRSFHTVHAHVRNIHQALGVHNRARLVIALLRQGVAPPRQKQAARILKNSLFVRFPFFGGY